MRGAYVSYDVDNNDDDAPPFLLVFLEVVGFRAGDLDDEDEGV